MEKKTIFFNEFNVSLKEILNHTLGKTSKSGKLYLWFLGIPVIEVKNLSSKVIISCFGKRIFKFKTNKIKKAVDALSLLCLRNEIILLKLPDFIGLDVKNSSRKKIKQIKSRIKEFEKCSLRNVISNESDVYWNYIIENNLPSKADFVDITDKPYKRNELDAKLIAFYLPQFHSIPLNDKYYGKGFTEWTNVTKAMPHFKGHYQPHLPYDVGFYDLAHDDVMYRQIELAKMYGIYGFCFHYYWFSGTRQLEKPLFNYLNNKELDLPFCLCWANENWAYLWDGGNKDVIQSQELKDDDGVKFINDILPFLKDERYIKIDGKPVLIIYRPHLFDRQKFLKFLSEIREVAKRNGFDNLYLITANSHDFGDDPSHWGFDAMVEFPPHQMKNKEIYIPEGIINPNFTANILDLKKYIDGKNYLIQDYGFKVFKCLFPSWDNTARKAYSKGAVYYGATPSLYKKWLSDCIDYTKSNHSENEQFVFINAWNEWAEGAHLEPCQKYGYQYLQATKEVLENKSNQNKKIICVSNETLLFGAQLTILNIIKILKEEFGYEIAIFVKNGGELEKEFAKYGEIYNLEKDYIDKNTLDNTLKGLKKLGYNKAICNTTVMGSFIKTLVKQGIETISLVHDLPQANKNMRIENEANDIAEYAKKVVFPANYVAEKFKDIINIENGKVIIQPQGLYQKNVYLDNLEEAKSKLFDNNDEILKTEGENAKKIIENDFNYINYVEKLLKLF